MNNLLLEKNQVKNIYLGDLNASQTIARVSFEKSYKLALIVTLAAAAADFDITFKQHTAASAGTTADLKLNHPYFKKLDAATYFSKVDAPAAAHLALAEANGVVAQYVFEFNSDDLDEGYNHISAVIVDPAVAQVACIDAIAIECKLAPSYAQVI